MSKPNNYQLKIGQIINSWEVVEPFTKTPDHIKNKRPYAKCKCLDCGKECPVNIYDMIKGSTKNCGCTRKKNVIDKKFGLWTVISKAYFDHDTYYNCKCECGKDGVIKLSELTGGHSKSCGCGFKITTEKEAKQKAIVDIFHRNKDVNRHYSNGNLPIGLCSLLIQLPCFYCGRIGVNYQKINENSQHSEFVKENANIRYNGLDRFSNKISKTHDMNNVVPACPQCNFFKLDRSYDEMVKFIPRLNENPTLITANQLHKVRDEIKLLESGKIQARNPRAKTIFGQLYPEKMLSDSKVNTTYLCYTIEQYFWHRKHNFKYKNVGPIELEKEDVAEIRLANCVYCGKEPNLKLNQSSEVDRIDRNGGYVPKNCTPACRYCNSAKSFLSVEEFINWMKVIKSNFTNLPKTEQEVLKLIDKGFFIEQAKKLEVCDYFDYIKL